MAEAFPPNAKPHEAPSDDDHYTKALDSSGCKSEHLALQVCFVFHLSWRPHVLSEGWLAKLSCPMTTGLFMLRSIHCIVFRSFYYAKCNLLQRP